MYLYHLVYFSKRKSIQEAEFQAILETSRRNNAALGVTGALFKGDEHYFQVLEGPRTVLSSLIALIMNDPRHEDVVLTLFEALDQRNFGEWQMAELSTRTPEIRKLHDTFATQFRDPHTVNGAAIWNMIESMAAAILEPNMAENTL